MASYDVFFFGVLFFLLGILFASLKLGFWILVITALAVIAFFGLAFWKKNRKFAWPAFLAILIIPGAMYFVGDDVNFRNSQNIVFEKQISFAGVVANNPVMKNNSQEFYLRLEEPLGGRVLIRTAPYPRFNYGDELSLAGEIQRPEGGYADYLAKERVGGIAAFADIRFVSSGRGSAFKAWLFGIKNSITDSFQRVLPGPEAAFLSGLTLGGTSGFSDDFKQAMSLSGTTHLVALSGYNITIIVWAVMGVLLLFFRRRASFAIVSLVILCFVLMTGAESSVVRAAIMAFLVLLAREAGRVYDLRNAIIFTGLAMVLVNPKVLVFDIGFELSFLAMLGIVYLRPVLQKLLRFKENAGFLSWKDNLLTTASAQLMVAPLLIANFNNFSLTSLAANVLVLEIIPLTMAFGFLIALASIIASPLALVLGWLVWPFLKFEMFVIRVFAELSVPLLFEFGLLMGLAYYLAILFLIVYVNKRLAGK
ncbi:MAG: internalization-related competence protein ComEC/Rec2 protein [Candidatus Jorgensenbacteria bacterium GW2011_GWA1_48_11]|uniref:Internalization-related competence protein ComEC/Rec2 protein n=1 Tax=Candidatus Jorgensenbacteria bacterium GW2011_GWA1_48_11 TaxID=1618660 RepID=A0A0G1U9Y6_9BACT|nr:MAG: internalization-related competence protein ComEC/Rec2 protein [Candidatus Jorgensenbacteria bacterium GW2011_GWA1_48_11]KKW12332.1 MAG: internalization-related competence protein ComEC/Rec2 protein [Candidatus Jorgensenbacteria bacterium GW2011_GWB1_49_9]